MSQKKLISHSQLPGCQRDHRYPGTWEIIDHRGPNSSQTVPWKKQVMASHGHSHVPPEGPLTWGLQLLSLSLCALTFVPRSWLCLGSYLEWESVARWVFNKQSGKRTRHRNLQIYYIDGLILDLKFVGYPKWTAYCLNYLKLNCPFWGFARKLFTIPMFWKPKTKIRWPQPTVLRYHFCIRDDPSPMCSTMQPCGTEGRGRFCVFAPYVVGLLSLDSLFLGGLKPHTGSLNFGANLQNPICCKHSIWYYRSALATVLARGGSNWYYCYDYRRHHQSSIINHRSSIINPHHQHQTRMSPQNFHSVVSLPTVLPHLVQDQFLPQEPVDVPLNASALSKRLQEPWMDRWFLYSQGEIMIRASNQQLCGKNSCWHIGLF